MRCNFKTNRFRFILKPYFSEIQSIFHKIKKYILDLACGEVEKDSDQDFSGNFVTGSIPGTSKQAVANSCLEKKGL